MRGSDCCVGWQIVSYTCKQAWSACDPCSRQTPCLHGEWHRTSPPVESLGCILHRILRSDSALFIKPVLQEIHNMKAFAVGTTIIFFLYCLDCTQVLTLRWKTWQMKLYSWHQPLRLQHHKYQEAVAMIDSLMTELCKSFNPFIKLNRGHLMHFTPAPLPIWLL